MISLQEPTLRWRAERARGQTWYPTVVEILLSIHKAETLKRLHISTQSVRANDEHVLKDELAILTKYVNLALEICAARSWSQCQFTICVPYAFALVHHRETAEREKGIKYVKKLWDAVLHAERVMADPATDGSVKDSLGQIMKHMAWHKSQIACEIYMVCNSGGWTHVDPETRELAFSMFGAPANTKHFLEDCFAHLADLAKRVARHVKMSKSLATKSTNLTCFQFLYYYFLCGGDLSNITMVHNHSGVKNQIPDSFSP